MDKQQSNHTYVRFETASVNGATGAITAPLHAVQQAARPTAVRTGELQGQTNKWVMLAISASATFMTTLDGSIVNIGLPSIARTFNTAISGSTEWIIIGYLVVIAATLLTFGRLADMIGRKSVFLTGLVIFILGSALSGLAPSLLLL
ncbi:MAG TPA: MFS transporter, partial [Ktedonobacteraceae bacterium]|nr:MFS transporter [Ktedonobacteraceae bacterium]